jgi:serine/threonine-protein kinase RsbT
VPRARSFPIRGSADVYRARRAARELAAGLGFSKSDAEQVALAVSELGTNLVRYARDGVIVLRPVKGTSRAGLEVESRDAGPGIGALDLALADGYSTGGGLGGGLPATRRLMDEFTMATAPTGTRIVVRKWTTCRL